MNGKPECFLNILYSVGVRKSNQNIRKLKKINIFMKKKFKLCFSGNIFVLQKQVSGCMIRGASSGG